MLDTKKSEQLEAAKFDELEALIQEMWQIFDAPIQQYRWPLEIARWYELVFCLLLQSGKPELSADAARSLTNFMVEQNMLSIGALASMVSRGAQPDFAHPDLSLMVALLERVGLDSARAQKAITTICEAAYGLENHFGGKVQRYLRRYGQEMLDELHECFPLTQMGSNDAQYAFTRWLQNVLDMPLPKSNEAVDAFCLKQQITTEQLVHAADEFDLNLALLDDMIATTSSA